MSLPRCLLGALLLLLPAPPPVVADPGPVVPEREVVQQAPIPPWKELWDQGRQAWRRQQPAAAQDFYQQLLAQRPQLHEARWELVRMQLYLDKPGEALPHLELLYETSPQQFRYGQELAATLLRLERFGRAAELYGELLRPWPDEPRLLAGRATALLGRQEPEKARPYLEKLVRLAPAYPGLQMAPVTGGQARENLARLYLHLGRPGLALPLVRELAAPAEAADGLLELAAEVHEELGRRRQAAAYWQRLLARERHHPRAAAALEAYMVEEGEGEEALAHLLPRLADTPDDPWLLQRVIEIYLELGELGAARPHLEHYLKQHPDDQRTLERLAGLYQQLGLEPEALVSRERLLALGGQPDPDKLLSAARLFEERGAYQQAIELYSRIRQYRPADPELIARQLRLLDRLGREGEVRALLEEPQQRHQLWEILSAWRRLAPDNRQVIVALALVELERRQTGVAAELLAQLEGEDFHEPEALRARAWLNEQRHRPKAAWQDYEALLRLAPQRRPERLRALELAADLGLPEVVAEHRQHLLAAAGDDFAMALTAAAALRRAHDLAGAHDALEALAPLATTAVDRVELRLEHSRLYQAAGLSAEAAGELRLALLEDQRRPAVLLALGELALAQQRLEEAATWLTALERWQRFNPHQEVVIEGRLRSPAEVAALAELGWLRQELASGDDRWALRRLRLLLAEKVLPPPAMVPPAATALLAAGKAARAAELLLSAMDAQIEVQPELLVLAARAAGQQGQWRRQRDFLQQARQWAAADPGRALELLTLLARHEQPAVVELAEQTMARLPASLTPPLQLADALAAAGASDRALAVLEEWRPAQATFLVVQQRRLQLLLAGGQLDGVLATAKSLAADHPWIEPALVLPRVHALWLQQRREEALAELAAGCEPTVKARWVAAAVQAEVLVPADEHPGFWGRLTGADTPLAVLLDEVMAPAYVAALKPGDERLRRLAAPLYADYRRQQRLKLELAARRAVEQREFFAATRHFERLVREYPGEQVLLYDLAGLYGRLQRLESEAAAYRQLTLAGVAYPGLEEAKQRNQRQRRPRTTLEYGYLREEGRDGRKAMVNQQLRAYQRWVPRLGHELDFVVSRHSFRDPAGDRASLSGRQAELRYRRDALAGLDIFMSLGARSLVDGDQDFLFGEAGIAGDYGDRFRGEVAYRRTAVDDTLEAVAAGIVADSLNIEGGVDLLPRLEAGAGYIFHYYSTYHQTHGYDLWLDYSILTDPTRLTVGYRHDYRDSSHSGGGGGAGRPTLEDAPFWLPVNYWRKTFEVSFRHRLSDDPYGRDPDNHYTLRYATTYDSDGRPHQLLAGGLGWEWSSRWRLRLEVELHDSSIQRRRDFNVGLSYRW